MTHFTKSESFLVLLKNIQPLKPYQNKILLDIISYGLFQKEFFNNPNRSDGRSLKELMTFLTSSNIYARVSHT
mgnify:CR=1 FL=1